MDKKERFSFRKYKVGLVSVLVGAIFLAAGAGRVSADELSKAAGVSQIDPTSNIEQVVQATESSSTADFAQVASMEEATTEVSGVESTATASATAIIPYKFGIELAKGGYQIKFSDLAEKFDNLGAGKFSSFSSWGLTKDGALKLDVAAPDGSIYSSYNNDKYDSMSGTSMASPHVAGVVALVKQYLKENFPEKSDEEVGYLVKALIMSTDKAY